MKFLIVGGVSAIVNIGSRIIFNLNFSFMDSVIFAFFVALTTAFLLNKYLVFEKSKYSSFVTEYFYFLIVNLFGLAQTIIISLILIKYIFPSIAFNFHNETTAHSIGVIVPVFTSYIGHKYLSFRKS